MTITFQLNENFTAGTSNVREEQAEIQLGNVRQGRTVCVCGWNPAAPVTCPHYSVQARQAGLLLGQGRYLLPYDSDREHHQVGPQVVSEDQKSISFGVRSTLGQILCIQTTRCATQFPRVKSEANHSIPSSKGRCEVCVRWHPQCLAQSPAR